jgi:general nucleoside transport system permease protein
MAQATTMDERTQIESPYRFAVNRQNLAGIAFLLVGIFMLLRVPGDISPNANTRLVFGDGVQDIFVPTQAFGIFTAVAYIIGGAFAIAPFGSMRLKNALLIFCGVLIIPVALILAAGQGNVNVTQMLESSFRLATPITLGALAGLWCERAGVVNIASEGMMLTGACLGFISALGFANVMPFQTALFCGIFVSVLAGGLMALLHGWLSITFMTDQVVSGTVINILAIGLTSFLRREILLSTETARATLRIIQIPVLSDIPVIGAIFFTGKPIFLFTFVLVIVTHIVVYYTRWGLRTTAVGENPHAADTLGINVIRMRYINVMIGGLIAGVGGAWFSIETVGLFEDQMTGGLGFIGLAAMIFGKYRPFGALMGALLFGFSQALNARFQIFGVPIPAQFIQMTPYIVTMIVLAGLVGRAVGPKADGVPYKKE